MIQRICDRCGKVMERKEDGGVSSANGHVIVKAKDGGAFENWEILDLCLDCRLSFLRWLGMNKGGASCACSSAKDAEGVVQHG